MVLKRGARKPPVERDLEGLWFQSQLVGDVGATRRIYNRNRARGFLNKGFLKNISTVLQIVQTLQRNGVYVPRIKSVDYLHGKIEFEHGGKTLFALASRRSKNSAQLDPRDQREKVIRKYFFKAAKMIGIMHRLGISHGHPHYGNLVILGNKIGFIDFKAAKRHDSIQWDSSPQIWKVFHDDYRSFIYSAPKLYRTKLFERLIAQYPCSQKVKQKFMGIEFR